MKILSKTTFFLLCGLFSACGQTTDTVTFNASRLDALRRGNIGFLHSLSPNVLPVDWVTDLKPIIWRGGATAISKYWKTAVGLRGADGYDYLKNTLHVPRQIFIVTRESREFRDEPYKTIASQKGFDAAIEAMVRDAKAGGYDYEWEVLNEPKFEDMNRFMNEVWNPTVRAIRRVNPQAIIHGPSSGMVNSVLKDCHAKLFDFLDRADKSNTLPNIVNWHFQDGYEIAKTHGQLASEIREFYRTRGRKLDGVMCGETVRPGSERNTSPAVAIDVFAAVELYDLTEIHAAWGAVKVYGQDVNPFPVLDGLLTTNWSGRRGVWWTYRFYAQSSGRRMTCVEGPSGSERLVALGFADGDQHKIRAMVGLRDGIKTPATCTIRFTDLSHILKQSKGGAVRAAIWDNPQTETAVNLTTPNRVERLTIRDGQASVRCQLNPWGAVLIEITPDD